MHHAKKKYIKKSTSSTTTSMHAHLARSQHNQTSLVRSFTSIARSVTHILLIASIINNCHFPLTKVSTVVFASVLCLPISLFEQLLCWWLFCHLVSWTRRPLLEHLLQSIVPLLFHVWLTPSALTFPPLHLSFIWAQTPSGTWALHRLLPFQGQLCHAHGGQLQWSLPNCMMR